MKSLIANLIADNYLTTPGIISAFTRIHREDFLSGAYKKMSHLNIPLPIGYGQTISQPATVAIMLELLGPTENDKILDVGSGSGWTTALLAEIVGPKGQVYGLERIQALKDFGEENIRKYDFIEEQRVVMVCGNAYKGLPKFAPFDKILVSAAARQTPKKLLEQLSIHGRMVIPIGESGQSQRIFVIDRLDQNNYSEAFYPGFTFVPLINS